MSKIKFIFFGNIFEMNNIKGNFLIWDLLLNYCRIIKEDIINLYFIYKGKYLKLENKLIIKELKNKNIILFVLKKKNDININNKKLHYVICPKCKYLSNLVLLNFDHNKIILDKCINFYEFEKTNFYIFPLGKDMKKIINIKLYFIF